MGASSVELSFFPTEELRRARPIGAVVTAAGVTTAGSLRGR